MEIPAQFFRIRNEIVSRFYESLKHKYRSTIAREAGGGVLTLSCDDDFVRIDSDGTIIDNCIGEDFEGDFMDCVSSISVSFYYEFDEGRITGERSTEKHVPDWSSPMLGGEETWLKNLSRELKLIDRRFSNPDFDYEFPHHRQAIITIFLKKGSGPIDCDLP